MRHVHCCDEVDDAAPQPLDVERLAEERLVPYYGPLGEPKPTEHMRRCIACGRTSKIVPVTDSASVKHEPDCAVLALLNDLIAARLGSQEGSAE